MEIHPNALKRGFSENDLLHAYRNAHVIVPHKVSPDRDLYIGPLPDGALLELVIEDPDTDRAIMIHAMHLRRKFYRYLEGPRA